MSSVIKQVLKYLKENGGSTLEEISNGTGVPQTDLLVAVGHIIEDGYVVFNETNKTYKIKFVLNPVISAERLSEKTAWDYNKIQEKLATVTPQTTRTIPEKWRNPYLSYLPDRIDQGDRGTCVGFSSAIGATLLYYQITKDLPTPEEVAAEKRNVEYKLCSSSKPLICDQFNKRWKSPQFIYMMSRLVGNVTSPEGSYVSAAVKALNKYGSVFETECTTSKTPYCVAEWYPTLNGESTEDAKCRIMLSGLSHLTEGYAQVGTFDAICDAVYTHGFALIAINIYENYTRDNCEGNYPDPNGSVVGSHAQCVVGYDKIARTLEFRQSWGNSWTNEGGISERYFEEAASEAFIILDENETKVGQTIYTKVAVTSNVNCTYKVDNDNATVSNGVVALERGVRHTITATAVDASTVTEPTMSVTFTPLNETHEVDFTFTKVDIPSPVVKKSLIRAIYDLIIAFLSAFKRSA
jgi:hypothetical protein